ncbi:hypothetical protein HQ533_03890 [Candidatus Woesearchaeota archaeon]|nr:hypothetical protein [Candidatus Woesearchaeota archaeon]
MNDEQRVICIIHSGSERNSEDRNYINDYIDQINEEDGNLVISLSDYPEKPTLEDIKYNIDLIKKADEFRIYWKHKSRELLFNFGMLFAARKVGKLINESLVNEVRVEGINKQVEEGLYVPGKTYEHVALMLQYYPDLINLDPGSKGKKSFMICPVRNAGAELERKLNDFVMIAEEKGRLIYYPKIHTNQTDPVGISICAQNRGGIEGSKEGIIYRLNSSEGSDFDKGMLIYFDKPAHFINVEAVKEDPSGRFDNLFLELHKRYAIEDIKRYRQIKEFAQMANLI